MHSTCMAARACQRSRAAWPTFAPMSPSWILGGVRTPFARAGTAFKHTPAYELGRVAMTEALARYDVDPARLDHVIFGNCAQPPEAANIARVTAIRAGVPQEIPGYTVHRNCASGMEAIADASTRIAAGESRLVLAGGMENMSQIPLMFPPAFADWLEKFARAKTLPQKLGAATRFRFSMLTPRIAIAEGLTDYTCGLNMGQTAEVLANEFHINRERQDA